MRRPVRVRADLKVGPYAFSTIYTFSTIMAMPWPTPMHMVARP